MKNIYILTLILFVISCGNTSITESHDDKQLIHIYDILGRSCQIKPNQIFIYYYSYGTIEKKLIIKKVYFLGLKNSMKKKFDLYLGLIRGEKACEKL